MRVANLRSGGTVSCGCYHKDDLSERTRRHGALAHWCGQAPAEYRIWQAMRQRCNDPSHHNFRHYGGRGIAVCSRWDSFEAFLADMGPRPSPKHSIDRIDVRGAYEPSNCRWADAKTQARNKNNNRLLTHDGRTQCMAAWAEELGLSRYGLASRLDAGWSIERALSTPRCIRRAA